MRALFQRRCCSTCLSLRGQSPRTIVLYMLVGAMQLGIMYLLAFRAPISI